MALLCGRQSMVVPVDTLQDSFNIKFSESYTFPEPSAATGNLTVSRGRMMTSRVTHFPGFPFQELREALL